VWSAPLRHRLPAALARRDAVVKRLRNGVRGLLKHGEVQIVTGRASFAGPRTLVIEPVANDIGAGKAPRWPRSRRWRRTTLSWHGIGALPYPCRAGHSRVLDTDGALALTAVPASIVVVGAGASAVSGAKSLPGWARA